MSTALWRAVAGGSRPLSAVIRFLPTGEIGNTLV